MEPEGLTNEQTDKVLEYQNLTGIEDMTVCRDVLIRHQWNLEVAYQEQQNINEGRPTVYATTNESRAPVVVDDRILQQVFLSSMPGGRTAQRFIQRGHMPRTIRDAISYFFNIVFPYCYNTIASIIGAFLDIGRSERLVTDPTGDVLKFVEAYHESFPSHPVFYRGTYAQALSDAKQMLRFLLVYLHEDHNKNPDVESFCRTTLADPSVIGLITRQMLFWACDISSPEGYRVAHSINARVYPTMVLIGLRSNKMVIMGRFQGDCTAEELVQRLQRVINANSVFLNLARSERLERNFTQTLRQQQDEAYQLSLRADEEKERKKEREKEAERLAIEAKEKERLAIERRRQEIAQLKIDLAVTVPAEPPVDASNSVCVVFKLPNGARIERRFRQTDSLLDLYNYLFCHPLSPDDFEITRNFPKRVLYSKSSEGGVHGAPIDGKSVKTIADVGLTNREVLFVNDLDA